MLERTVVLSYGILTYHAGMTRGSHKETCTCDKCLASNILLNAAEHLISPLYSRSTMMEHWFAKKAEDAAK